MCKPACQLFTHSSTVTAVVYEEPQYNRLPTNISSVCVWKQLDHVHHQADAAALSHFIIW